MKINKVLALALAAGLIFGGVGPSYQSGAASVVSDESNNGDYKFDYKSYKITGTFNADEFKKMIDDLEKKIELAKESGADYSRNEQIVAAMKKAIELDQSLPKDDRSKKGGYIASQFYYDMLLIDNLITAEQASMYARDISNYNYDKDRSVRFTDHYKDVALLNEMLKEGKISESNHQLYLSQFPNFNDKNSDDLVEERKKVFHEAKKEYAIKLLDSNRDIFPDADSRIESIKDMAYMSWKDKIGKEIKEIENLIPKKPTPAPTNPDPKDNSEESPNPNGDDNSKPADPNPNENTGGDQADDPTKPSDNKDEVNEGEQDPKDPHPIDDSDSNDGNDGEEDKDPENKDNTGDANDGEEDPKDPKPTDDPIKDPAVEGEGEKPTDPNPTNPTSEGENQDKPADPDPNKEVKNEVETNPPAADEDKGPKDPKPTDDPDQKNPPNPDIKEDDNKENEDPNKTPNTETPEAKEDKDSKKDTEEKDPTPGSNIPANPDPTKDDNEKPQSPSPGLGEIKIPLTERESFIPLPSFLLRDYLLSTPTPTYKPIPTSTTLLETPTIKATTDTITVGPGHTYIPAGTYKREALVANRKALINALSENTTLYKAAKFLVEETPQTVKSVRAKLDALMRESLILQENAKAAIAEYDKILD